MASSREGGIVYQPGNPDGRKYAIKDGFQDRPVLFVTWLDAARYSNWLCNGGGPLSSTETGAYDLIGSNGNPTHRRPGAKYWIPNENEWYKAAYYRVSPEGRRIYSREARWEDAHGSRTVSEIVDVSPPGENGLRFVAENERGRGAMPIEFDAVRGNDFARGFRVAAAADSGKSVVNLDKSILPVSEGPAVGVGPGIFFGAPFQNAIFTGEIQREAELPPSS